MGEKPVFPALLRNRIEIEERRKDAIGKLMAEGQ
jgi:hypothetical protein